MKRSHGMSKTKIYRVWCGMRDRCYDENHLYYYNYGGRGITVSTEWKDFAVFYNDMKEGYKEGLMLDRIDNDLGYCKENCKWSSRFDQDRNKRTNKWETHKGLTMIKNDWAAYLGVPISTINSYINHHGVSFQEGVDYYIAKKGIQYIPKIDSSTIKK